jgi:7-cyano-7-deazaguanine reductase
MAKNKSSASSKRDRAAERERQPRVHVGAREMPPNPPTAPSKELHVFANPSAGRDYVIRFEIPEFTCLCPLTGQPDFAQFTIDMICDALCIELKSLKMYMWGYRDEGAFHEKVTNTILDDLVEACAPRFARISAKWNVRGGIYTTVVAEHRKKGWRPQEPVDLPAVPAATTATGLL